MRAPTPQINWLAKNKHGIYARQPVLKINSEQGIIESVKKGVGIATLASYIAKEDPELIEIKIPTPFPPVEIYFSYHESFASSGRVRLFREFITQELHSN
jgi:DNA-binding transcriptional LysR family regulator